jgi:DNA-binding NarL/FixJ family response regulator
MKKSCNVFLVEDSPLIRARLAQALRDISDTSVVGEAETPASAIAGILREHPHVVVLDIQLADGSGLEVLREIRRVDQGVVFVVFTSSSFPQYRKTCMKMGANYFLDKNSEYEELKKLLAELSVGLSAGLSELVEI